MINNGARFSPCGEFRYSLWREWDGALPQLAVVMLNPSTADAKHDDHTITKLIKFAKLAKCGRIQVVNLFAYRATKPSALKAANYPVGPNNDRFIRDAVIDSWRTLCAWGGNAAGLPREVDVRDLLRELNANTYALRVNADGTPAHPLMLPYSCTLEPFAL